MSECNIKLQEIDFKTKSTSKNFLFWMLVTARICSNKTFVAQISFIQLRNICTPYKISQRRKLCNCGQWRLLHALTNYAQF